jgi:predicted small integral membrane protein
VAVFFICIVLMLIGMTVWERRSPTVARKGFLPLVTTRGDRLFISLLGCAYLHLMFVGLAGQLLIWFELSEEPSIWWATATSVVWLVFVMRKG